MTVLFLTRTNSNQTPLTHFEVKLINNSSKCQPNYVDIHKNKTDLNTDPKDKNKDMNKRNLSK